MRLSLLIPVAALALSASARAESALAEKAPLPGAAPLPPALQAEIDRATAGMDPRPRYTNRLALSASPYLRLHAHHPIDWRPYGEEAFRAARESGRPLFISIGYATCHWCRVMEEESYRDPEVGAALNAGFVAVKVDREAQPELAESYARSVAAMGERVGWPLHVFLLPDGSPILGATYLPRRDRPGRPGILTVLASIGRAAGAHAPTLGRRAEDLREALTRALVESTPRDPESPDADTLQQVVAALLVDVDPEWGGRRDPPKRPTDPPVSLLLRHHRRGGDERVLALALRGLERMAAAPVRGGDGGFHEGVGARDWSQPRGEKRLADNAALAIGYLEAWQVTGRDDLREIARGVLDFLLAELATPEGGFSNSLRDAQGERLLDDQVLADANGLALSALARGGFALSEPRFVDAARAAAAFLLETQRDADGLHRAFGAGRLGPLGELSDHALLIAGLLDLLEVDSAARWLEGALALQREQDARFGDAAGGYFLTAAAPGPGLPRPKHARDGSLPAANGVSAWNLLRLHALTGDAAYLDRADALLAAFGKAMRAEPAAHSGLAAALDARLDGLHEIALLVPAGVDPAPFLAPLRTRFVPNRVLLVASEGPELERLTALAPLLAGKRPLGGVTAYVCRDQVCAFPARSPERLATQLERFTPLAGETTPRPVSALRPPHPP